ncbi:conserved hypothetical protein [Gloeothece citriformis PCC 7424]|uniref:Putative restriction endonuclease domain-containing protein n=1 Tax=Gloeothece citriformis (strain PCC 7424) TaxID=65393 RepID=B7K7H7_GLOC7|nr:Uma2 family endonuclease [Gloeothece citriformis]ACK69745.1 conserved hypothetical protein [Gloeothece citriformis PCC 7424]
MTSIIELQKTPKIIWEKLPDDYILPDDPVDNISQPLLASALTEAIELQGLVTPEMLIAVNMGICVKVEGKIVIKAPDWFYVPQVFPLSEGTIRRSYTPHTEGDVPAIVMEFLSETEGGEYSIRPIYPYGKLWFYEKIIKVPTYVIFEPDSGRLEVRELQQDAYELLSPDEQGRYFISSLGIYLGVWYGKRLNLTTHWLRWWDEEGNLLLWGSERMIQDQQRIEQAEARAQEERQRAEAAEQEIARLREILKNAGISEENASS